MSEPPTPGMWRNTFRVLSPATPDGAARLGRLSLFGRRVLQTPGYTAVTSRGAVPHLTPDNLYKHTSVGAAYMALEDFIERSEPPIYQTPPAGGRALHRFTALPDNRATILAARRCPPVLTPMGNTKRSVTLFTSTGFAGLTIAEYAEAVELLRPDVVVAPGDSLHTSTTPSSRKLVKMTENTEAWVDRFLRHLGGCEGLNMLGISVFAPVLPVELSMQWEYLGHLADKDMLKVLSGLAIYDANLLPELVAYPSLVPLPKLSLDAPWTPHEVLRQVALGVDVCTIPFINSASDAGVALTFRFPPPAADAVQPLGVDLWSQEHGASLAPLLEGCQCYTCACHHSAYLNHLLHAREMLGWSLLQIHNHHVVDEFFAGVRRSLGEGLAQFERDRDEFTRAYEPELPAGSGERPRARGYHFKSEAGQDKINKASWTDLAGQAAEPA